MIFRKGIKRLTHIQWQPVPFLARVSSSSNRAWPGWFLFAKRIHFKVHGFMQEVTVGAKDFNICWIRGRQHMHRYRAEIEWICIPFIRFARGSLPAEEGRHSWHPRRQNQGAWLWMQIAKVPDAKRAWLEIVQKIQKSVRKSLRSLGINFIEDETSHFRQTKEQLDIKNYWIW